MRGTLLAPCQSRPDGGAGHILPEYISLMMGYVPARLPEAW